VKTFSRWPNEKRLKMWNSLPEFIRECLGLVSLTLCQSPKESVFHVITSTIIKHQSLLSIEQNEKEMYGKAKKPDDLSGHHTFLV